MASSSSSSSLSAPGQNNLDAYGHDIYRLRVALEDPTGLAKTLRPFAKKYGDAYHDCEINEMLSLCAPNIHVNSLWGVVRGHDAFAVMVQQEKESIQIMWNSKFKPVTPTVFVRHGTAILVTKNRKNSILKKFFARPTMEDIREHVVVDPESKLITFRSLSLNWHVMQL